MKVTVSAASSLQYYGYYLGGLRMVLGDFSFHFARQDMPRLASARDGLCVVLQSGVRLYFAADDFATVNLEALDWCDVYGQINLARESRFLPEGDKFVSLGPGFGIRWEPRSVALRYGVSAALTGRDFSGPAARLKAFGAHQRSRAPLRSYRPGCSDAGYLFFLASYWTKHPEANAQRTSLWTAIVNSAALNTEGGFVGAPPELDGRLHAPRRYNIDEYIARTQRSVASINTPAVHGCIGWKLGEFLALGKAIVSSPIGREMPGEFLPGAHYLLAEDEDEAVEHLVQLSENQTLRRTLERNARMYFDEFVSPEAAVRRMLAHCHR